MCNQAGVQLLPGKQGFCMLCEWSFLLFPASPELLYLSMTSQGMVCVWQLSCSCPLSASSLPLAGWLTVLAQFSSRENTAVLPTPFQPQIKTTTPLGLPWKKLIPSQPDPMPCLIPYHFCVIWNWSYCLLGIQVSLKVCGLLWALSACSGFFQEWIFFSLSGQPVSGFDHLYNEWGFFFSFYLIWISLVSVYIHCLLPFAVHFPASLALFFNSWV